MTQAEPQAFIELRECDAILQSPAYPAMSEDERAAFFIRYQAAAANARMAAGRAGPKSAGGIG